MKRVLLATTALCMSAGTAVADVALSGEAEMGVAASKDKSVRFHTDIDVTFTLSGETDGGVTFGSAIDIDEASDDGRQPETGDKGAHDDATQDNDDDGGIAVFMEDADGFGKLTLGDVDGAYDWAMDEIASGGIRDDSEHGAYSGNSGLDGKHDGQILLWNRAIGSGFSMGASVELDDHDDNAASNDPIVGFGGRFSMPMGGGTVALGGGVQMGSFGYTISDGVTDDPDTAVTEAAEKVWDGGEVEGTIVGGSAVMNFGGDMGGLAVTLNGSVMEADGSMGVTGSDTAMMTADVEQTHLGVGFGYTVGGISLGLNVGSVVTEETYDGNSTVDDDLVKNEETVTGVGLDVAYDLGGGATLMFGVGSSETETDYTYGSGLSQYEGNSTGEDTHDSSSDANQWSLGVKFKF